MVISPGWVNSQNSTLCNSSGCHIQENHSCENLSYKIRNNTTSLMQVKNCYYENKIISLKQKGKMLCDKLICPHIFDLVVLNFLWNME